MPTEAKNQSYIQKFAEQVDTGRNLISKLRAADLDPNVKGIVDQLWNNQTAMQTELRNFQTSQ